MLTLSHKKICKSNAGYYIGYEYLEGDFWLPYSRESVEYYPTKEKAQDALKNNSYTLRTHP